MTSATRTSLRVTGARPRRRAARRRPLRTLGLGVMGLALVASTVAAAVVGAGKVASAMLARGEHRSMLALAPPGSVMPIIGRRTQIDIIAGLNLPEPHIRQAEAPHAEPRASGVLALAGDALFAAAVSFPDVETTGSIGDVAHIALAPPGSVRIPSRDGVRAPLPPTRPMLAALSPPGSEPLDDGNLQRTAVYDIAAKVVYMPSGERLEAHSGLGSMMDDPRHVHQKNRGPTPPNVYTLRLRESLFHGVKAIRMTPVNERTMFNRDGILAHSYMLGPSGQSNGCVSFKDYPRFLKAFLRGEVDRMIVVTRLREAPPMLAKRAMRSASASAADTHAVE